MRILRDQSGQSIILAVLCFGVLMGGLALAVDVGNMQFQQRRLQTAADSAAIAAALEISNCGNKVCANMNTAAEKALIEDAITTSTITPTNNQCTISSSSSLAMTINVSPCVLGTGDPNQGNTYVVEVVLTEPQTTFFAGMLGMSSMNLVARAEAGEAYISNGATPGFCLWAGSILFNSSDANFNLTNCGAYDNGNLTTNSGDSATATDFLYYGSWSPNNCNSSCSWTLGDSETQPAHTNKAVADPLASLTEPSQPATEDANNCSISNQDCWGNNLTAAQSAGTSPVALPPGYYGGGININSPITANFSPGLYYFNGSLNVDAGATLECTTCSEGGAGVTLFFKGGSFQPNSSSTVTLNGPATGSTSNGDVANMLVWQSASNSSGMDMDASTTVTLNGIIYLPSATLTLNSGSGTTIDGSATAVAVDVEGLIVNSAITFDINGSQSLLGTITNPPTLGAFSLVE